MFETIFDNEVSDIEFLYITCLNFHTEMGHLFDPYSKTTEGTWDKEKSLAHIMRAAGLADYTQFDPEKSDPTEFNRSAVGMLILRWLLNEDYDSFTECQDNKVSRSTFDKIARKVKNFVSDSFGKPSEGKINAALYFIALNDMGKCQAVIDSHIERGGAADDDHDIVLSKLIDQDPRLIPYFDTLGLGYQAFLGRGIQTVFNVGHLVHCENEAVNLERFAQLTKTAKELYLVHAICDIGGAQGHINPNGSVILDGIRAPGILAAIEQLDRDPPLEAIARYAKERFVQAGQGIPVNEEDYALAKLAAMARIFDAEDYKNLQQAWEAIGENSRDIITKELNHTGLDGTPFILLTYLPPIIANGQAGMDERGERPYATSSTKGEAIYETLKAMESMYTQIREQISDRPQNGFITINLNELSHHARDNIINLADRQKIELIPSRTGHLPESGHAKIIDPTTQAPAQRPRRRLPGWRRRNPA